MTGTFGQVLDRVAAALAASAPVEDVERVAEAMVRAARAETAADDYPNGATLARILGTSKQNIQQRAARGSLLHIADEHGVRFPLWQVVDGVVVAGVGRLTAEAHQRGIDDTALVRWMEAEPHRVVGFRAGKVIELVDKLPTVPVAVSRLRVAGRSTALVDEQPSARRASKA
jgi:hypothetical protein